MSLRKTFIFFIVILLTFFFGAVRRASAQEGSWPDQGYAESMRTAESGDVNAAAHVSNVNTNNYSDLVRRIVGPVPGMTTTETGMTPYNKRMLSQSALYTVSNYITAMYLNPPASTYAFIRDAGQSLGFIPKTAYAQGIGFSGLSALLPVWKVFRNMAYFVLALFMIVIGFMVMFRKKIDPKTVVTVQNALPRIVITLLLITFSYAIVGVFIDIMYILIAIIGSVFLSTHIIPTANINNVVDGTLWSSVFDNIPESQLMYRVLFGVGDPITIKIIQVAMAAGFSLGAVWALVPGGAVAGGAAIMILTASPALIGALFSLGLLFLYIRLFIFFLSTYIKIVMALIFSPFQLLLEAFPGSKSFDSWFRGLVANILIFPAATVLFLISAVFMQISTTGGALWHPPYTAFLANNATSVGALMSLGILFMIPSVGKMIHDALKSKPSGVGGVESIGGIFGAPIQTVMQAYQFYTSHETMKYFKNQGKGTKRE